MIDAATIHQCADPGLKPAIVEKFIRAVGAPDPLAVTVRTGNRVILMTPPKTPDDAMELVRRYVGHAMVRVGVTQYPAGLGVTDVAELKPDLVDACANIRMGTALFGKVYRIVIKWYGTDVDEAFGDAIDAWESGYFDGKYVFDEPDPGSLPARKGASDAGDKPVDGNDAARPASRPDEGTQQDKEPDNPNKAGIRIDLTGIGVSRPK
ncbi:MULTISPECIES: TraH family protein [Bradyrhizobium]|uniref:Conjugal transfer protein TraH n=1 Tax=Bradyrhizobium barranii subsp. barranii TaxID=2823807 RepID=A0A939S8F6_9BRAD|nr:MULTISPECIES: TraH family protein [Bradyrhizobium]MBR1034494.1 conjugal transfer protein TraH [Bradyrhizobium liaoningense]UEM18272.1 conjugal transfer protein TraH [Bradyrhizobium barranii subsp. barranii]